tara:strand:- start:51 stop:1688 length:1638 start_codon:yes stop_codon:yes gene_type:complete
MANIVIEGKNEEAFDAVLQAFGSVIDTDVIPMSNWSVEPDDSTKTVQIGAKVHVPRTQRISIRDRVADYLERLIDNNRLSAERVITGTKSNPLKEQFDLVIRYEKPLEENGKVLTEKQRKPQVIRIEIKPENTGGARGGSDNTTIQEFALAVFLAIRYNEGKDLECHPTSSDGCLDENDYVYGLSMVDGRNKPSVEDIMSLDGTWKHSCIEGANKIANEVKGSGWRFLRGDSDLDDGAIKKAYIRCKDKPEKTDLKDENKWNPSDIWMVQDGKQSTLVDLLNQEGTITCLNNFIALAFSSDSFDNKSGKNVPPKSLIGISLKKLGKTVDLKVMNPVGKPRLKKAQGIIFNKNASIADLTSFSAMDVYLIYGRGRTTSFQTRNFAGQNKGDWKLELVGVTAAQGKVQGQVARDLMTAAGFSNIPQEPSSSFTGECKSATEKEARNTYENKKGKKMTNAQKGVTDDIYDLLKKYKAKGFSDKPSDEIDMKVAISIKDASWRYSKLCGLRFLDWLCKMSAGRASRAMKELYLYASSQTDKSSVHYKLY